MNGNKNNNKAVHSDNIHNCDLELTYSDNILIKHSVNNILRNILTSSKQTKNDSIFL